MSYQRLEQLRAESAREIRIAKRLMYGSLFCAVLNVALLVIQLYYS